MYSKDAIRFSLNLAESAVLRSLANIEDQPMTFPTQNGGCHPLWVIGHLAYVEGLAHTLLTGSANPVEHWGPIFGQDSTVSADATQYPAFELVRAKYTELRQRNLQLLDSLSEAELDKPTAWQPKGLEEHFATYGKSLLTLALHQMGHRAQLTDATRSSGRTPTLGVRQTMAA